MKRIIVALTAALAALSAPAATAITAVPASAAVSNCCAAPWGSHVTWATTGHAHGVVAVGHGWTPNEPGLSLPLYFTVQLLNSGGMTTDGAVWTIYHRDHVHRSVIRYYWEGGWRVASRQCLPSPMPEC